MTKDEVHRLLLRRVRASRDEDLEAILADYAPDIVHRDGKIASWREYFVT